MKQERVELLVHSERSEDGLRGEETEEEEEYTPLPVAPSPPPPGYCWRVVRWAREMSTPNLAHWRPACSLQPSRDMGSTPATWPVR